MHKGKRFLAIIPARSGSKGLKNKNIRNLNGMPMLAYSIEAAIKSKIFDCIFVSTDSEKYAEISRNYGAEVPFLRPDNLASDLASTKDVIKHTISELKGRGLSYDYIVILQPTSPLRNECDIIGAIELLFEKNATSVVSVCETEHSPLFMNTLDESLCMKNFISPTNIKRRQDLDRYYRLNGAIYICNVEYYQKYENLYNEKSFAYIMEQKKSVDIDSELDFMFAEFIMKNIN